MWCLVYLDAYIPQDNKSAFDIVPGLETIYKQRALKEQYREWLVASYTPEEFDVSDSVDIEWMNSRLCPMPWHTHDQPLRIINPEAKKLPKSYILSAICCEEAQPLPPYFLSLLIGYFGILYYAVKYKNILSIVYSILQYLYSALASKFFMLPRVIKKKFGATFLF